MPGLFLPRFRPTDAIDARQIDRCVQELAEVLNGGLTAENLSPSYGLPPAAFTENRGVYSLKAFVSSAAVDAGNNAISLFGVIPYASAIVGFGFCLKADSFTVSATRQLDIMGGAAGATLIFRHYVPRREIPVLIGGVQYLIGFVQPRTPEIVAANDILRLAWPTVAASSPVGSVTLFLSAGWQ